MTNCVQLSSKLIFLTILYLKKTLARGCLFFWIQQVLCQLTNSVQHRSVEFNEADIKGAKQKGAFLSPLTIILDSGANLNIFSNINLLEQIKRLPSLAKSIQGASGCFTAIWLDALHPILATSHSVILIIITPPIAWLTSCHWQSYRRPIASTLIWT